MRTITKYKLIRKLCKSDEQLVIFHNNGKAGGFMNAGDGLADVTQQLMESCDAIKDFIVDAACTYLKKYEVQKQEFAKRLYNQETK